MTAKRHRQGRRVTRRSLPAILAAAALTLSPLARAADPPTCAGQPATIVGTAGPDQLQGTGRADVIWGGLGDDRITAGPGDDLVCAGPGDDQLLGEGGADTLLGGGGADTFDGGSGDNTLSGGPGNDTLLGRAGNDHLAGAAGDDLLSGGPGADLLDGGPGADHLDGGEGADEALGADGDDALAGGAGDDTLEGGPGNDTITGGDGSDHLAGGTNDDTLEGGPGNDACDGGPGRDSAAACEEVQATEDGQVPGPVTQPGPHQVALTFDDGPSYAYTEQILDILSRYDVPATFFIVGRHAADQPALLRRLAAEGHSVQNHSYDHRYLTGYSDAAIQDQLARTNRLIEDTIGVAPHCMRPPYGAVDDRVRAVVARMGLATIMWDVNPSNWAHPGAAAVARHVLRYTQGGDIVLLHDLGGPSTIGALPAIIEGLQAKGLELVSLCTVPGIAPRLTAEDGRRELSRSP